MEEHEVRILSEVRLSVQYGSLEINGVIEHELVIEHFQDGKSVETHGIPLENLRKRGRYEEIDQMLRHYLFGADAEKYGIRTVTVKLKVEDQY
ncbi:unnamed protein product [marine sediment metagenome]|uniref:Uncharacterized protein n=1 Tax=marine sediment metagenome TaxID=412755 RepID=X0TD86_9ZZZZ